MHLLLPTAIDGHLPDPSLRQNHLWLSETHCQTCEWKETVQACGWKETVQARGWKETRGCKETVQIWEWKEPVRRVSTTHKTWLWYVNLQLQCHQRRCPQAIASPIVQSKINSFEGIKNYLLLSTSKVHANSETYNHRCVFHWRGSYGIPHLCIQVITAPSLSPTK